MEEIWKDIKGYEGMYQISNLGNVKSLERYRNNRGRKVLVEERIMKQATNTSGYKTVVLSKDGEIRGFRIHRLVAETFIPNPNNLPQINHIDENKNNNTAGNLEWCTARENMNHGTHNQRSAISRGCGVKMIDDNGNIVAEFNTMTEAYRSTGIWQQNIGRCIAGKSRKAGGYYWEILKSATNGKNGG